MFEFQTAISELTGLPVSNASVYEGPSAVAAAGYLAKLETGRAKLVVSRGLHPHSREALITHAAGYRMTVEEAGAHGRGRHRRRRTGRARRRRHRRGVRAAAQLPRDRGGARRPRRGRQAHRRPVRGRRGPAAARHPQAARRAGRGHLRGRGPDAGQPARLRRAVVRLLRRRRALPAQDAGPHRRRDPRRGRQARLRAHPPDARAAHPPREGHAQHLHRAGAQRAGRRDLPLLARQARTGGAGRADGSPHPLRARGPGPRGASTPARWCASSPCGCPTSTGCSSAPAPRASTPATASATPTRSTRTACWWRSPSGARKADIDRLAALVGSVREGAPA